MPIHQKNDVVWFCSKKDPFWEFSNMAGQMPIFWPLARKNENWWNSSEQLYQACKYDSQVICRPRDNPEAEPKVRRRIRSMKNARGAKMTQKCAVISGLVRSDWESEAEVRLKAMWWVIELKVYWNRSTFGEILKNTGEKLIVEVSSRDTFWGCREEGAGSLVGENKLGEILMGVRSRIPEIMSGDFKYPEGWLLP